MDILLEMTRHRADNNITFNIVVSYTGEMMQVTIDERTFFKRLFSSRIRTWKKIAKKQGKTLRIDDVHLVVFPTSFGGRRE